MDKGLLTKRRDTEVPPGLYPGATQGHSLPPHLSPIPMEDWAHGYHGCVSLSPLQDSLRGPSS